MYIAFEKFRHFFVIKLVKASMTSTQHPVI